MKKWLSVLTVALMCVALLAGCGGTPAPTSQSVAPSSEPVSVEQHDPVTLTVAAAASLENTYVNELIPMFQEKYDWITVEGSYDSSGKLQTQIEEGLEADVFMSAATKQMNALVEQDLVDGSSVVELLENEIVLIAPIDSDTDIDSFERIVEADSIALGDPASVPAGQYAEEALTNLGVWEQIQGKTSFGTNVTEVLNAVAEGSADVGIVYATDAAQMPDKVKVIAVAPEGSLETKVIYPVGIVAATANREAAELFVEFLQSPEAMAVFVAAGFRSNI
jgi:molybdate transport system substrate-binding protein